MAKTNITKKVFLVLIIVFVIWSVASILINIFGFISLFKIHNLENNIRSLNNSEAIIEYCDTLSIRNICLVTSAKINNDTSYCFYLPNETVDNKSLQSVCLELI